MISDALFQLADAAHCASGDFHVMHLNAHGSEFDRIHEVLKTLYEEADDDYDSWAELACMWGAPAPNPNESATRIKYGSAAGEFVGREQAVNRISEVLQEYVALMVHLFQTTSQQTDPRLVAVQNALQTRIEFWAKQVFFFNSRRRVA